MRPPLLLPLLLLATCAPAAEQPTTPLLALVNGRVYASPDAAPLDNGVVLVRGGTIAPFPGDTTAIRRRIETGEIQGPRILTAGIPLYPHDGIPYYVTERLPPDLLELLHQQVMRRSLRRSPIIRSSVARFSSERMLAITRFMTRRASTNYSAKLVLRGGRCWRVSPPIRPPDSARRRSAAK